MMLLGAVACRGHRGWWPGWNTVGRRVPSLLSCALHMWEGMAWGPACFLPFLWPVRHPALLVSALVPALLCPVTGGAGTPQPSPIQGKAELPWLFQAYWFWTRGPIGIFVSLYPTTIFCPVLDQDDLQSGQDDRRPFFLTRFSPGIWQIPPRPHRGSAGAVLVLIVVRYQAGTASL